jgi:predicted phosphodiesterase
MKFAKVTDTHYGFNHKTHKIHMKLLKELAHLCKKGKIEALIHCGDWASSKQNEIQRSWKMFREYLGDLPIYTVMGNHDCLDKETELLTKRGWIKYSDILKADYVFSNTHDGFGEWTKINKIIIKQSQKMFNLKNLNIDMCITESHRILHSKRSIKKEFSKLQYSTIKEITKGRYRFPLAVKNKNLDYPISDDEIRLLAWVFTDGSRGQGCQIWQSKINFVNEIRELLNRLGYKYSESKRERNIEEICGKKLKKKPLPQYCFNIFSQSQDFIKEWINTDRHSIKRDRFNQFSNRQLILFIRTLVDGDGSYVSRGGRTSAAIDGKKEVLDWFQSLAVQCNVSAFISEYRPNDFRLVIAFDRPFVQIEGIGKKTEEKEYNDIVWCLNVPHSNFMVRRNNKAYFTGNCWDYPTYGVHRSRRKGWIDGKPYSAMESDWEQWAGEYDISLMENHGPIVYPEKNIAIYGFNGWYDEIPPLTNDNAFMPKTHHGAPIHQFLRWKAQKEIDKCLEQAAEIKIRYPGIKCLLMTHHGSYNFEKQWQFMSANLRWMEFIAQEFDYYCVGHSHRQEDFIYRSPDGYHMRCINAGSCDTKLKQLGHRYNAPVIKIFDTEDQLDLSKALSL